MGGAEKETAKGGDREGSSPIYIWIIGGIMCAIAFAGGFYAGTRWAERTSREPSGPTIRMIVPPGGEELGPEGPSPPEHQGQDLSFYRILNQKGTETTGGGLLEEAPPLKPPGKPKEEKIRKVTKPGTKAVGERGLTQVVKEQPKGRYVVQVGSFRNPKTAQEVLTRLKRRGYPSPRIMEVDLPGKGRWFRVRVGWFSDRREAEALVKRIERKEGLRPYVLAAPAS